MLDLLLKIIHYLTPLITLHEIQTYVVFHIHCSMQSLSKPNLPNFCCNRAVHPTFLDQLLSISHSLPSSNLDMTWSLGIAYLRCKWNVRENAHICTP